MKKRLAVVALSLFVLQPALAKPPGSEGYSHNGGPSQGHLPRGLEKQGKLPPGWERKLMKGSRLDNDIYAYAVPLTPVEIARLPPTPTGMITVRIENQIVRLQQSTLKIDAVLRLP